MCGGSVKIYRSNSFGQNVFIRDQDGLTEAIKFGMNQNTLDLILERINPNVQRSHSNPNPLSDQNIVSKFVTQYVVDQPFVSQW